MRKRTRKNSSLKNQMIKAIPISVALSLLSAGAAFADVGKVRVFDESVEHNTIIEFYPNYLENGEYTDKLKATLKEAYMNGKPIFIQDDQDGNAKWINFSGSVQKGVTYDVMVKEAGTASFPLPTDEEMKPEKDAIVEDDKLKFEEHDEDRLIY